MRYRSWSQRCTHWTGCLQSEANSLGPCSLALPVLELGMRSLDWDLQFGGLQSRTTDIGAGDALTGLGAYSLAAYGLGAYSLALSILEPGMHSLDWGPIGWGPTVPTLEQDTFTRPRKEFTGPSTNWLFRVSNKYVSGITIGVSLVRGQQLWRRTNLQVLQEPL